MEGATPLPFNQFRKLVIEARKCNLSCCEFWDPETGRSVLALRFWTMPVRDKGSGRTGWAAFDPDTGELLRTGQGREAPTDESLAVARDIASWLAEIGFTEIARKTLANKRPTDVVDEPIRLAKDGTLTVGVRADLPPDVWESAARVLYRRYRADGSGG